MKIVIAGAGEVGTHLAKMLSRQNHSIMLIDSDHEKLEQLEAQLDILSEEASCTSVGALEDAGVSDCDLFIAVNHEEDRNITSSILRRGSEQDMSSPVSTTASILSLPIWNT